MYNSVLQKVNSTIKYLYRNKRYFDFAVRKMLVNSLIQPRLDYAFNLWYRPLGKVRQHKLQICQNKSMRFILDKHSQFHLGYEHFKTLNYLNVSSRVNYLTLCQVYNIVNKKGPMYMQDLVKKVDHNHNTRSSKYGLQIHHVNSYGQLAFSYNGSKLWNNLSNNVKECKSKDDFKFKCKKTLLNNMKMNEESEFVYY